MSTERTPPFQNDEDFEGFADRSVAGAAATLATSAISNEEANENPELLPLIRQRQNVYRKLLRIQDAVTLTTTPDDLAQLRVSKQKLKSFFDEFSGFHNQIIAATPDNDMRRQEREYIRFEQVYDWTSTTVEGRIIKCETRQVQPAPSSTPQVIIHQQPLKAPIPTFDGDYMKWPKFKAMFMDVMAQSRDSDAIKLYHLDKALVDKAAGVIDARTINEGNYAHAWNILIERYENQRVIVETHLHGLLTLPKMSGESSMELQGLLDRCTNHVESLQFLKQEITGISELLVVYLLTSALDSSTRRHWEQSLKPRDLPKYRPTVSFLKTQIEILERWEQACPSPSSKQSATKPVQTPKIASQRSHAATTNQESTTTEKCAFCGESHFNFQCNKLSALSSAERIEKVRSAVVCFNCFRKGHFSKNCPSSKTCRKCQKRHHTQLHEDDAKLAINDVLSPKQEVKVICQQELEELSSCETVEPTVSTTCSCSQAQNPKTVLLLTAIVLVKDKNGQALRCRVLLDSGSQVNFVTEKFVNSLGIPKQRTNVPIAGINNLRTTARDKVVVQLRSRCTDFQAELECLVTPKVTGKIPSASINVNGWNIPSGIQLADPTFFKADNIDMLIGADIFFKLLKPGCLTIEDDLPELRESQLGWLVTGTVKANSNIQYSQVASIESIEESIQRFWQIEEVPDVAGITSEEQRCEDHFVATHSRDETGRYVVRLPFKDNADQLDNCRALALKRFFMLEQRLQRQPELRAQYVDFIREYQLLGHCKKVDEANDDPNLKTYYLPHHAVLRPGSSTTKCRVVFNASAKSSPSSLSLNDVLMVGPVVQSELFTVTIRSRKHRYVFKADVSKMYRQIRHHPDDMHYLRSFWRIKSTDHLEVLEMTTVTYGTASAPFQATRCLIQLAQDEGAKYPLAAQIVVKDTYVDDVLSGCDTLQEAKEAVYQLKEMLNQGNFPIHKWCSNSPQVLEHIPSEEQEPMTEDNTIKSLGLVWKPITDVLKIAGISLANGGNQQATKRTIYSDIAKLYDPLGLVSPTIVRAKLLVQQLWRCKSDWDDPVSDEINNQWCELRQSLQKLAEIEIPRQVTFNEAMCYDLQGFADASNVAYGACVYVRSIFPDGSAKSRLLCSKSKVAPLHAVTIPRMELCAALLLSRLVAKVIPTMEMDFGQVTLWSDNQIVLAWLNKSPDRLEVFVRNRVAQILRLTEGFQWNYVSTLNNPADVVSRGQLPSTLAKNELWWNGPDFLTAAQIDLEPVNEIPEENLPELKTKVVVTTAVIVGQLPVFNKFSCFRKLQRVIGWVLRFKNNACKIKEDRVIQSHLTVRELRQSTLTIIRVVQQVDLKDEIHRLESCAPSKRLGALNPIVIEGVLRVGGRLKHSKLPEEAKHQLILPSSNPTVKLLIRTMHIEYLHVGPAGLLSAIRQRFWLLNARSAIRQIIRTCVRCFRTNPTGSSQLMGELPKQRVVPSPPFSVTGIDYAGPILVKQGRYRPKIVKSYIAVFVCMATKAIHLELVSDMTANAFIAALKRFIARRGMVNEMHSDNGTNFRGAHHELHGLYELFQDQQVTGQINSFCQTKEMEWHFIPPDAPEFGGLWEAAVKSTKTHLKKVVGNATLTFEELTTLLCEIEAVLNSRPLFAHSIDPADPEVITPAHFLVGRPLTSLPEPMLSDAKISRLDRWQHLQLMRQHFWTAWSRDYLSSLQPRKKNRCIVNNIKPGMIILLHDRNHPPLQWKLGRVTAVYPGTDELVRAVDVFSEGATYRRPITKLSVLPIEENQGLLH